MGRAKALYFGKGSQPFFWEKICAIFASFFQGLFEIPVFLINDSISKCHHGNSNENLNDRFQKQPLALYCTGPPCSNATPFSANLVSFLAVNTEKIVGEHSKIISSRLIFLVSFIFKAKNAVRLVL